MGFNSGLMGAPDGSAQSMQGYMYHQIMTNEDNEDNEEKLKEHSKQTEPKVFCEVRSGFTDKCVEHSQINRNLFEISVVLNIILFTVLLICILSKNK